MITDRQTRLLRQKRMEGKTQETAAAKAGMSVRSARKWQSGPLPSQAKPEHRWRTRPDPFDGVWEDEIEPLLRNDPTGKLKATTIIDWLAEQHPGRFSASQLRTLQRRLQDWRALHGPDREVYFPQVHPPGREAQFDFTHCGELKVTIAGQSYPHLLFQLILSHSGWRYAEVAAGETFLALQQGLQNALWTLGGVPEVVRSDNTSAATHELRSSRGRALNDNYAALLEHYGLRSTRINPGQSHENGIAEHAHYRLKDAIDQALMLRGSRDFHTTDDYADFVRQMVERRNRLVEGKLEQEMPCLGPLPPAPVPEYANYQSKVRRWCTIQVAGHSYSVPSRLIGKEVQIRLYADWVEVYYKGHLVERMERVRGEGEANVNYRHVIGSLVRKPGAFARYRFREQLFPTMHFRLTYDALREWRGERADVEYVRILHLAASTMAATVDSALSLLLEAGESFDYAEVRDLAEPKVPEAPVLTLVWEAGPENLRPLAHGQPGHGGGVRMTDTSVMQDRIGQLCGQFKLPTMGAQSVARFTAAGHGDALATFLEVLEQEAEDRRHRRINRLRRESRLPSGKTWETFEHDRVPLALRQQLDHLAQGSFVERGVNVLAFGLPGTGKTHALCALGHRLVEAGHSVLFAPAYRLVQELLAAKRDLDLPRQLRKLDNFDFLLLDDLGYLPQGAEESEVLFTLIAERYERRSLGITSNLVFSEWERIFANPMATAAAIDRVVHHSVILEFDVPSYRTDAAQQRGQAEEVNRQN